MLHINGGILKATCAENPRQTTEYTYSTSRVQHLRHQLMLRVLGRQLVEAPPILALVRTEQELALVEPPSAHGGGVRIDLRRQLSHLLHQLLTLQVGRLKQLAHRDHLRLRPAVERRHRHDAPRLPRIVRHVRTARRAWPVGEERHVIRPPLGQQRDVPPAKRAMRLMPQEQLLVVARLLAVVARSHRLLTEDVPVVLPRVHVEVPTANGAERVDDILLDLIIENTLQLKM